MSFIWAKECPPSFHQASQTSSSPVQKYGDKINHLNRRHPDNVRNQGTTIAKKHSTLNVSLLSSLEISVFIDRNMCTNAGSLLALSPFSTIIYGA